MDIFKYYKDPHEHSLSIISLKGEKWVLKMQLPHSMPDFDHLNFSSPWRTKTALPVQRKYILQVYSDRKACRSFFWIMCI